MAGVVRKCCTEMKRKCMFWWFVVVVFGSCILSFVILEREREREREIATTVLLPLPCVDGDYMLKHTDRDDYCDLHRGHHYSEQQR